MASESEQPAMIDITVKTLDGQNRTYSVPDNFNVRQFKERISSSIEISADTQRLIFQGRVMQDDKILKDYNIHGKVIHLVQRAPPTTLPPSSTTTTQPPTSSARPQVQLDGNMFDVQIHMSRVQGAPNTREARARIRQADFNLRLINDILRQFERFGPRLEENDDYYDQDYHLYRYGSHPYATVNNSRNRMNASSPSGSDRTGHSHSRDHPGSETVGGNQQEGLTATDLANFLDQVLDTNNRVIARVRQYRDLLRRQENYPPNSRDAKNAQEVVNRVTEIFHAQSHMLHSLSDVTVNMSTRVPRQAVASPQVPFQLSGTSGMAVPIHMNVTTRQDSNRNRQRPSQQTTTAASTNVTTTAASTNVTTTAAPTSATATAAQTNATTAAASTNATTTAATSTRTATATQNSNITTSPGISTTVTSTTSTPATSTLQAPPVSQAAPSTTSSSSPTFRIEVIPTSVTVRDVTTVITHEGGSLDSDSSDDDDSDDDNFDGNGPNITVRSSTSFEHTVELPTTAFTSANTAPSAPQFTTQRASSTTFTSSTSSSSTFTFDPSTNMTMEDMENFGSDQIPQMPGLPPDFLQNILGSLIGPNGMHSGQPIQVNIQETTTSGGPPSRPPQQQPNLDLLFDYDGLGPRNNREHLNRRAPVPTRGDDTRTRSKNDVTNTTPAGAKSSTNTTSAGTKSSTTTTSTSTGAKSSTTTTSTSTGAKSSTATKSTGENSHTRAPTNTSTNPATNVFIRTINLPDLGPRSTSSATRNDPNTSSSRRSTNVTHPFLLNLDSTGQPRHPSLPTWSQRPMSGSQGYIDPYLPCSSPLYMSQTALAAQSTVHGQARPQPPQQQIPNLSTMVSGMVGEIIGQASQQASNNQTRRNVVSTSTVSSTTSSQPSSTTVTPSNANSEQPPAPPNPLDLLSQLLLGTGQGNPVTSDIGAMISSIMQLVSSPSGTLGNTTLTLADIFSHLRIANGGSGGETGIIVSALEAIASHISLTDLFSLVTGNAQVLTQVRTPLREFMARLVDQHGSLEQVVEVTLEDMRSDIQYLQSIAEVKDDLDFSSSLYNCLRAHLLNIATAIHSNNEGSQIDFANNLYSLWLKMLAETMGLCVYCVRDGYNGLLNMLRSYMPRMTQGMSPMFSNWMVVALQSILRTFYSNHPVLDSDIKGYIVNKPDKTVMHTTQEQNQSESVTSLTNGSPSHGQITALSNVNQISTSETSLSTPMDKAEPPILQSAKETIATTVQEEGDETQEPLEDAKEIVTSCQAPVTHPSTLATQVTHTEVAVGSSKDLKNEKNSNDWKSVVPQDWIPVISEDIVKQQEQKPQPPFSDVYLQGLPAKRRRMMKNEHSREIGSMPQYLPESLKRAVRAAGVEPYNSENMVREAADDTDLQSELEKEITTLLGDRITSDNDFNLDRFPNAELYFQKFKHN